MTWEIQLNFYRKTVRVIALIDTRVDAYALINRKLAATVAKLLSAKNQQVPLPRRIPIRSYQGTLTEYAEHALILEANIDGRRF